MSSTCFLPPLGTVLINDIILISMAEERVCIKGRYIFSNQTKRASVRVFSAVCSDAPTGTTNNTKDGSVVRNCRVADKTGSIFFSLWNEQAEAIEYGDILKLTKGEGGWMRRGSETPELFKP